MSDLFTFEEKPHSKAVIVSLLRPAEAGTGDNDSVVISLMQAPRGGKGLLVVGGHLPRTIESMLEGGNSFRKNATYFKENDITLGIITDSPLAIKASQGMASQMLGGISFKIYHTLEEALAD